MKTRRVILIAAILFGVVVWFTMNPPRRFGFCRFAWTTYNCIPHPLSDIQIRSDGSVRTITKTHDLQMEQVEWLLAPQPDLLIIATGWDGVTSPSEAIKTLSTCEVRIMPTGDAIQLFNSLRGKRKVAIHLHSTC